MKVAVIDTETTDLSPHIGHIVEVALVTVDTKTGEIKRTFNMMAHPDLNREAIERSWIVRSGHIAIDEIMKARVPNLVAYGLRHHLGDLPWTSFNLDFDRGFLEMKPWNLKPPSLDCIMNRAVHACKLPHPGDPYDTGAYKWPKLSEAYAILVGDGEFRGHRAMDDAVAAAKVMLAMIKTRHFVESG